MRALDSELYSHIPLIPFISGYLVYLKRKEIFSGSRYSFSGGGVLIAIGIIVYIAGRIQGAYLGQNDYLSVTALSAVILFIGGFVLFFGIASFRTALFPLLFLFFMVPVPAFLMDKIVYFLQTGSAEVSSMFFNISGVPVFREGLIFHLPAFSVEVAKECSGIRSSLALLILGTLSGQLFLRGWLRKLILIILIIPLAILKNGIRIVTLTLLGAYVDVGYLTNSVLHRNGGVLFFLLGLMMLAGILWLLRKSEKKSF